MLHSSHHRSQTPFNIDCSNVPRRSRNSSVMGLDQFLQIRSIHPQSASRVFIKREGKPNGRFERRSSNQQQNNWNSVSSAYALPRRSTINSPSSFLLPAAANAHGATNRRVSRSLTSAQLERLKPITIAEAGSDSEFFSGDVGHRSVRPADLQLTPQATKLLPKCKENVPPLQPALAKRSSSSRRSFNRKQTFVVPKDHRTSLRASRVFLVPRIEAPAPKPEPLLPRRTSVSICAPRVKKTNSIKEENSLISLPTQVLKHTPKPTSGKAFCSLVSGNAWLRTPLATPLDGAISSLPTQVIKHTPRCSPLAPKAIAASPSSLNGNLRTLPTQVIRHTPCAPRAATQSSAADSPCLSKARSKTIWTMADEITLVRAGGILPGARALEPSSYARVIPLCQRLRNGVSASGSALELVLASTSRNAKTPSRSASTPYHLLAASARRVNAVRAAPEAAGLPGIPSLSRVLAHAQEESEKGEKEAEGDRKVERYNWTVVNFKKHERLAVPTPDRPRIQGPGGYGVYVGTGNTKPSLLTRAQTLVKLRFTGPRVLTSRKLVGRGDSRI